MQHSILMSHISLQTYVDAAAHNYQAKLDLLLLSPNAPRCRLSNKLWYNARKRILYEKKNEKKPQTTTTIGENRSITNQHMRSH